MFIVLLLLLLSIGLADYASGIRVSLAVFYIVTILLSSGRVDRRALRSPARPTPMEIE